MAAFCTSCGHQTIGEGRFCAHCGKQLSKQATASQRREEHEHYLDFSRITIHRSFMHPQARLRRNVWGNQLPFSLLQWKYSAQNTIIALEELEARFRKEIWSYAQPLIMLEIEKRSVQGWQMIETPHADLLVCSRTPDNSSDFKSKVVAVATNTPLKYLQTDYWLSLLGARLPMSRKQPS